MSHIAICDDQGGPLIDSIVQEITNRGHTVTEVYEDDANECVEAIFEEQTDLLVLDLVNHGRGDKVASDSTEWWGWQILDALRALDPKCYVKVIVCSRYLESSIKSKLVRTFHVNGFLDPCSSSPAAVADECDRMLQAAKPRTCSIGRV
jgi:CheY-like chemotaxis protein